MAKIGKASNLLPEYVISAHNCQSIYEVPLLFNRQNLLKLIQYRL